MPIEVGADIAIDAVATDAAVDVGAGVAVDAAAGAAVDAGVTGGIYSAGEGALGAGLAGGGFGSAGDVALAGGLGGEGAGGVFGAGSDLAGAAAAGAGGGVTADQVIQIGQDPPAGEGSMLNAEGPTPPGAISDGGPLGGILKTIAPLLQKGGVGMGLIQTLSGLYGLTESNKLKRQAAQPNLAGEQAVQRSLAAQGYQGSGNMMAALNKYGGQWALDSQSAQQAALVGQLSSLGLLTGGLPQLAGWGSGTPVASATTPPQPGG